MKTLLYVDCCIRREASRTRKLAEAFLSSLPEGWRVEKVTLMDEPLLPLMEGGFAQREELLQRGDFAHRRFDYAWQFQKADAILIAAPFYDLSIPALLKVYIENVSVDGITFECDAPKAPGPEHDLPHQPGRVLRRQSRRDGLPVHGGHVPLLRRRRLPLDRRRRGGYGPRPNAGHFGRGV